MGDYTPKLAKVAADVVGPGEALLAGSRAMSKGSTKGIIAGATGAVAGGAVGMAIGASIAKEGVEEGRAQAGAAGIDHAPQIAIGLTDRRLLIWKRGGLSGKPKDLIGEIPLDLVGSIDGEDSGSKLKPDRLTVHLTDGAEVEFEIVKADGYEKILTEFQRLRSN
jgi:hypothetical protein